jgi:hypothetical protein
MRPRGIVRATTISRDARTPTHLSRALRLGVYGASKALLDAWKRVGWARHGVAKRARTQQRGCMRRRQRIAALRRASGEEADAAARGG